MKKFYYRYRNTVFALQVSFLCDLKAKEDFSCSDMLAEV